MSSFSKMVVGCLFINVLGGCSIVDSILPDYRADYKKSKIEQPLEIPPDLIGSTTIDEQLVIPNVSANSTTTLSDYENVRTTSTRQESVIKILPPSKQAEVKHYGKSRWLVLQGTPDTFWPKVKRFWLENGFTLKVEDPTIGIMETEWAENYTDLPQTGISKYISKVFNAIHSSSTRDKYRIRLERNAGVTELFITHRGAEEVAKGNNFIWQSRPSDPELEAEMLKRLMVFIGIQQADILLTKEQSAARASLVSTKEGQFSLIVNEKFAQTWRDVGLALDRVGFTVEDRNRSRGVYFIRYVDSTDDEGFFANIFGSKKSPHEQPEYLLSLIDESPTTRIVVLDSDDKISSNVTAKKILAVLQTTMNGE